MHGSAYACSIDTSVPDEGQCETAPAAGPAEGPITAPVDEVVEPVKEYVEENIEQTKKEAGKKTFDDGLDDGSKNPISQTENACSGPGNSDNSYTSETYC